MTKCPVCNNKISFLKIVSSIRLRCNNCKTKLFLNKEQIRRQALPGVVAVILMSIVHLLPYYKYIKVKIFLMSIVVLLAFFTLFKILMYLNSAKLETEKK